MFAFNLKFVEPLPLLFIIYLGGFTDFIVSEIVQSLAGKWGLQNLNGSIAVTANIPGGIYSDLQNADILEDIYYRFNDIDYRWVANETWIYSNIFKSDEKHFDGNKNIELVCEGLDTFSTIFLNGHMVGKTVNMFVRYNFDIKKYLNKARDNNLTIIFNSSAIEAQRLHEKYSKIYIIPPQKLPKEYKGVDHANLVRKMQASFAWDWGPAFAGSGIWKPMFIRSYNTVIIQDITVDIDDIDNPDVWKINLKIFFDKSGRENISGLLTTQLKTDIVTEEIFTPIEMDLNNDDDIFVNQKMKINKGYVKLWWPNGFGGQFLYDLKVTLKTKSENGETFEETSKSIRIGFRKLELVQNEMETGLTFYFKVNDVPIFAKGSNWIPANILPEKGANLTELRFLLQSAKDVHMNMLRVWGGGIYESDAFYDLADEMGILIWQDFMFACSMYPSDADFLETVKTEVRQQVRRLQSHTSIAVWAGNNENEAALRGDWYGTANNFSLYKEDYISLYVKTIRPICLANDPTRTYLVSSPSNGLESEKEGFIAKDPYDSHFGDIHYYNYLADGWNQNIYKRTRFSSEYGFQSLPSYKTLKSSTNISSDLKLNSEFLESRQHHLAGYDEMKFLINRHLIWPDTNKENYFQTYIYYTQISQAMAYKAQTEYYRQWRSKIDEVGNGLTMGALYWQLNDVWPGPSWSSVDFRQRWKMVHYFAKKFFSPLLISANLSPAGQITIYSLSDLLTTVPNATMTMDVYKWDSFKSIASHNITFNILPGYSAQIASFWLDKYFEKIGCGNLKSVNNNCFLYFTLKNDKGESLAPDNFMFPGTLKTVNGLETPKISVKVDKNTHKFNHFDLTITTDKISPFVWLESDKIDGIFSDNGFLQVSKIKNISFVAREPITVENLQASLIITSLRSTEHL